ncbi:hypothetical protein R1sor_017613 [Riccia sorocarpa]|uniref:Uncharacterized protein n=1 Tax=Riccia sorocarpa TaxID=122646 RepID=A0ABD3I7R5_9MARC
MKLEWNEHCRRTVDPVIGHASDGDSRRRKLMLADYGSVSGMRWKVDWEGWNFSGVISETGDVYGLEDQDPSHNGKKLINPLDRSTHPLVLGDHHACLEHVQLIYKLYPHNMYVLNFDDVVRRDRQNWAGPQRLCSRLVQKCLKLLEEVNPPRLEDREDAQQKRTFGIRLYLEVVADYIDIFYSTKLDLFSRVMNCAKVSFFFRLWRLWLLRGNHTVSGDTETLSEKNIVNIECWYDVQMSCHMVVLLCVLFRDKFSGLKVPLHLLGSDCCEHFFSRVGGMSGYERNYGFADLIDCAIGLNRLASMEYGEENIHFGRSHAKQQTIWGKLHPLLAGETEPDLSNFNRLQTSAEMIEALKKGFDEAQNLLNHGEEDDGADDLAVAGHETRHVMAEVFDQICSEEEEVNKFDPIVVFDGHSIYKATLVSQLVGNPTLSNDRLTRIKQSIYFNGVKQKPRVEGVPVCILDEGSDSAVLFDTETAGRSTWSQRRRTANTVSKDVWIAIGRVQKIRRKYNGKRGKTQNEIDLLDRPVGTAGEGCISQVLFNWYSHVRNSREKFTYAHTDLQWIDLESVITVVSMRMEQHVRTVWSLDANERAVG